MFYKQEDTGNWIVGQRISLASGTVLSIDNKQTEDGFFWSDEPPMEYVEWLNSQNASI